MLLFFVSHGGEGQWLLQMNGVSKGEQARRILDHQASHHKPPSPAGSNCAPHEVLEREARHECEWSLFCFAEGDSTVKKQNQVVHFPSLPEITTECVD